MVGVGRCYKDPNEAMSMVLDWTGLDWKDAAIIPDGRFFFFYYSLVWIHTAKSCLGVTWLALAWASVCTASRRTRSMRPPALFERHAAIIDLRRRHFAANPFKTYTYTDE